MYAREIFHGRLLSRDGGTFFEFWFEQNFFKKQNLGSIDDIKIPFARDRVGN